jgi:hypothetical protein
MGKRARVVGGGSKQRDKPSWRRPPRSQLLMRQDAEGLRAKQEADAARRAAGKMGMKAIKQQMQVGGRRGESGQPIPSRACGSGAHVTSCEPSAPPPQTRVPRPSSPYPRPCTRPQERLGLQAQAEAEYQRERAMVDEVVARIQQARRRGFRVRD